MTSRLTRHNIISVSQLVVGTRLKFTFDEKGLEIIHKESEKTLLKSKIKGKMYPLKFNSIQGKTFVCLLAKASSDDNWLWHKRLSHVNFKDINKLVHGDLVRRLPLLKCDKEHLCAYHKLGKQS